MKDKDHVTLVALHDFAGPEGSATKVGRGLVRRGTVFTATPDRMKVLLLSKMARYHVSAQKDGPKVARSEAPDVTKEEVEPAPAYEGLSSAQVWAKVEAGVWTVREALELEEAQENPRSTLLAHLRKSMKE